MKILLPIVFFTIVYCPFISFINDINLRQTIQVLLPPDISARLYTRGYQRGNHFFRFFHFTLLGYGEEHSKTHIIYTGYPQMSSMAPSS